MHVLMRDLVAELDESRYHQLKVLTLTSAFSCRQIGNTMKSQMLEMGIVAKCVQHLRRNAPPITSVLVKADDPFWKVIFLNT